MNNVNKTLYIPLFAKCFVSKKGIILNDEYAEKIWETEGFPLKGKAKSKWLSYYLGIRAKVFDDWVKEKSDEMPDASIIHIGCGLDSRYHRVGNLENTWYDVDFPDVISERRRYFEESNRYRMIEGNAAEPLWFDSIKGDRAIVIMEGIAMYLRDEDIAHLFSSLSEKFSSLVLLMDCYSVFSAKMSKYKNPVKAVGVTNTYGIDDPEKFTFSGITYLGEREMTPKKYVDELSGIERNIFAKLYAGKAAKKLYRLYEYEK